MPGITHPLSRLRSPLLLYVLRWCLVAPLAGLLGGSSSALLLVALDWATRTREAHLWLIALLPVAGLAVGVLYRRYGTSVERGNNLILDEIHTPTGRLPLRMAPLILAGTFLTHLFGGSAGREGTALQASAALADQLTGPLRLDRTARRILLMAGISAGFGSVFGTPLAGAVFGMEVLSIGGITYEAILPCLLAAFVGDLTTRSWGVAHTVYRVPCTPPFSARGLLVAALAGMVFGLVAMAFARSVHALSGVFARIRWSPLRPAIGGCLVAVAAAALHTTRYLGLGIPTIVAAFSGPQPPWQWAWKFAFTVVTLAAGFKGGEVTPLFFLGATLGNALALLLPLPAPLLAGMGFVAVFGGAANTPIAATLLAVELFGAEAGAYAAVACVFAYLFSGSSGIYHAQPTRTAKHGHG